MVERKVFSPTEKSKKWSNETSLQKNSPESLGARKRQKNHAEIKKKLERNSFPNCKMVEKSKTQKL